MFRARGNIRTPIDVIPKVIANMNIRKHWESQLYDMEAFDETADLSYCKTFYVYRSPMGVAHREFLLVQKAWKDFPEPGMWSLFMKTIEDERWPTALKGRVRATCHILVLVIKPAGKDSEGNDLTNCMLLMNTDINGLVPKWIVNLVSRSAPGQWFTDCQRACDMYKNGDFSEENLKKPIEKSKSWF